MSAEIKGRRIGGGAKVVKIGAVIYQTGKRQCVVIVRECDGSSLLVVFQSEGQALSFIKSRVAKGTIINANESNAWNGSARYEMKRINHQETYSLDGACTNCAKSFSAACVLRKLTSLKGM